MEGTIDLGDGCICCMNSTRPGSSRFVDRIPASNDTHTGYMCAECQQEICDGCAELCTSYSLETGLLLCDECSAAAKS